MDPALRVIGKAVQAEHERPAPGFEDREIEPVSANYPLADIVTQWRALPCLPRKLGVSGRRSGADRHGWILPSINLDDKYRFIRIRLSGHSQQIDDISLAFERPRIGLDEAMIDRKLAYLIKLVFADTDIGKAAR